MNKQRRKIIGGLSLFGMSVLTTGCIPVATNGGLLRRDEDNPFGFKSGQIEDSYKSLYYGSNTSSINSYSGFNSGYVPELSNQSQAIFDSIAKTGTIQKSILMPTENQVDDAISLFKKVQVKYATQKTLNTPETYEVVQHMLPLLRMYFDLNKEQNKVSVQTNLSDRVTVDRNGNISIPPGFRAQIIQTGYCLDEKLGAAKTGDTITLMPSSDLIEPELLPLYRAMQDRANIDKDYRNRMQKLLWTLRTAGQPNSLASHADKEVLTDMNKAMPGGANIFADYHNKKIDALNNGSSGGLGGLFNKGGFINPFDVKSNPNNTPEKIFQSFMDGLTGKPVSGENARDNRHFQMLNPNLVTYSYSQHELRPQIDFVNIGDKVQNVNLADWVMKPTKNAQHIAMYPTQQENLSFKGYPVVENPVMKALLERLKAKVDYALLTEGARFLNDKVLKNVSQAKFVKDFVFRYIGNTPAVKKVIEAMPYVGNAISLYEAVSGKNWINGRDLNAFERAASAFGTIPGGNFFKAAFKNDMVKYGGLALSGAGFMTNVGFMQKDIAAYAKTFTNPLAAPETLMDDKFNQDLMDTLVKVNESSNLSKAEKQAGLNSIRQVTFGPKVY
jgi:hypothetical protein